MAKHRIRDKIDAHLHGTLYGLLGAIAWQFSGWSTMRGDSALIFVVVTAVAAGLLCRWGWEMRRWYRRTRPGYDPLAGLRSKG